MYLIYFLSPNGLGHGREIRMQEQQWTWLLLHLHHKLGEQFWHEHRGIALVLVQTHRNLIVGTPQFGGRPNTHT
jgi:hypothetical protein